ncbi:hypothetical protein H4R24_005516 [Coemansia sp. RSA 988]|nr:hypothetical protein H4R24_005516 [Coemansia sp. RSA 988]
MRPDPYQQKASRKYQAAHRATQNPQNATRDSKSSEARGPSAAGPARGRSKYSRRRVQDNSWRFDEEIASAVDTPTGSGAVAETDDDADVRDFLDYLKEESQNISADQSAAYFRLRSEEESADLSTYNEDTWSSLVEINWDGLLGVAAAMPLHQLLGVKEDTLLPEGVASMLSEEPEREAQQTHVEPRITTHVADHLPSALELAPGISPSKDAPATKPSPATVATRTDRVTPSPTKPDPSVDDLEAFLDEIL